MKKFVESMTVAGLLLVAFLSSGSAFLPSNTFTKTTPSVSKHNPVLSAIAFDPRYQGGASNREERFERSAPQEAQAQAPCILQIDGVSYNLTAWAKAHPAGEKILLKFHGKDATKAFHAAGHSKRAVEMLKDFAITEAPVETSTIATHYQDTTFLARAKKKLFTKEDPIGIHKYMGIFVLLHFIFRYGQMFFGDPSCGLGTRLGKGPSILPALCLIPHAVLSLSSLIFHTVPKERVVGMPMIWSEYRIHNIGFGVRSVVCAFLAFATFYSNQSPVWRKVAIWGSGLSVIVAQVVADVATERLRVDNKESTTATMPYWPGCSMETQRRFKSFYAYCQFMATMACLAVGNPAWPLSVLLAIQMASLLMTLVRKGLLSARGYHLGYTATLIAPWFVGLRSLQHGYEFVGTAGIAWMLYQLRRRGVNKYALWIPVVAARILLGDQFIHYDVY